MVVEGNALQGRVTQAQIRVATRRLYRQFCPFISTTMTTLKHPKVVGECSKLDIRLRPTDFVKGFQLIERIGGGGFSTCVKANVSFRPN